MPTDSSNPSWLDTPYTYMHFSSGLIPHSGLFAPAVDLAEPRNPSLADPSPGSSC